MKSEWTLRKEQTFQKALRDEQNELLSQYAFDSSGLSVKVTALEVSKRVEGTYFREEIVIKDGDKHLVILELEDLKELEMNRRFVKFLSMINEVQAPIGSVMKLNRLELADGLGDREISALSHVLTILLMIYANLIVVEESFMKTQPEILQEDWKRAFMFYDAKLVEFEGIRYMRFDHPASLHH